MSENNQALDIKVKGTGRPVLFLHGFLESNAMWQEIELEGIKMIMPDLPGHGNSPDIEYHSLKEMASLLIGYCNELQLKEYDVVGHSMGGYVALEMKAQDPNCKKLVLLNSNFWGDSENKKKDRVRVAELVKTRKDLFVVEAIPGLFHDPAKYDEQVKELVRKAREMSSHAIGLASLAMMKRQDRSELINDSRNEVYIIQGKLDSLTTPDQMKARLPEHFNNYIEVHASHMSWAEEPNDISVILQKILGV